MKKFWVFFTIFMSISYNVVAEEQSCPSGCFCLNNGKYDNTYGIYNLCSSPATLYNPSSISGFSSNYGSIVLSSSPDDYPAHFYANEFSILYIGSMGFYGFKDNEFIYANQIRQGLDQNDPSQSKYDFIFQCPATHPNSAEGAKALNECFKYGANGNKIYYGAGQTIHCAAGTYLPAGATTCVACNTSQNHVCLGGNFERSESVQGLKINCYPGQYLPANATQCSNCDDNNYLCAGGLYEFSANITQGLNNQHNGYISALKTNGDLHTFEVCKPGQYIPALSQQCTACVGDYACPGGIFYTDATYNKDRGRILCAYGAANKTHTSCISQTTHPFVKREAQISKASSTQQNTQPQTNQPQQNTTQTFNIKKEEIKSDSESAKKIDFGSLPSLFSNDRAAVPVNRTISRSATSKKIKTTSVSRSANTPQRSINNGKKMRPTSSRGVATNR